MVRFLHALSVLSAMALLSSSVVLATARSYAYDTLLFLVGKDCANLGSLDGLTIFGPTDDAFADFLDDNNLDADILCGDAIDTLTEILLYHAVEGEFEAKDVANFPNKRTKVKTLQGAKVTINNEKFTVNGIDIVDPDAITNGFVLHGIDGVLIPPGGGSGKSKSDPSSKSKMSSSMSMKSRSKSMSMSSKTKSTSSS
eukprot:CAMPEP_0202495818 /NCGR_PEP_ID=MMETSP1361-20130828/17854_1 /ASSEMBLY_ACC=CAM_ASM_000849 /TAXON_ID=210615 /ORGANISM="Staurosira complex sp., Strain CCMP2646" /LENGTH=197 /DNA_ID=CAMNT_0049126955 /DNA_START=261 /DNA_END=854 /DNA_ORIENTATION=-